MVSTETSHIINVKEISHILLHRYPFLLIDRVTHLDVESSHIVGKKNVSVNEPFFQGHFPGHPIMPGVLVIESIAQTGGVLIHAKGYQDKIALLMSVNHAKFRRPILPGDVLTIDVKGIHFTARGGKVKGEVFVDDKLVAEAEVGFGMMEKGAF